MATTRELAAEYVVLSEFDRRRRLAGHDYGSGQRWKELVRYERDELRGVDVDELELTDDELALAFRRVSSPRVARLTEESYRRDTPSTRRTIATWNRLFDHYESRIPGWRR